MRTLTIILMATISLSCYRQEIDSPTPTPVEPPVIEKNGHFALGADVSWVSEMEKNGNVFYDKNGQKADCFDSMKSFGLDAIRLRVWVDPSEHDNWCNLEDFVAKARRAADAGMDIMVDFHYSDWWADPGKQIKPASWVGLGLKELKDAFALHTREVLVALRDVGIYPKWVQIGNEITSGFLWDNDKNLSCASYDVKVNGTTYPANWKNIGSFFNIGYQEVKSIFSDALVIVHLDTGFDNETCNWYLDELLRNGGRWDIVGLSVYPYWAAQGDPGYKADKVIMDCIHNMKLIEEKYKTCTMVVETGFECADDKGNLASEETLLEGKRLLEKLIKYCRHIPRCKGVFYWEPECKPSQYRLGAFTQDGHPTVIMEGFEGF